MVRAALLVGLVLLAGAAHAVETIEVWKSPDCGCCANWIDHLRAAGFSVRARNVPDVDAARAANGVPRSLGSCHTARVGGYAIEGHVPAAEIKRLLKERPAGAGLAVPGMPLGAPGMEGGRAQPYEVLLFRSDGSARSFARHSR